MSTSPAAGPGMSETAVAPVTAAGRTTSNWAYRLLRSRVVAALLYLAISIALFAPVWTHPFSTMVGGADAHLFVWWVKWVPWSLSHGENPLFTDYLNAPYGVNGMWNTSVAVLALLVAPITWAFGPIFSTNVLLTLGPAISGLTFFLVFRRYTTKEWPALIGGAVFVVAPFELAHLRGGHLNLSWNFLPPLIVLFLEQIFVRQRIQAWKIGTLFGITLAIQTLISTELLAIGVIMFCIGAFFLLLKAIASRKIALEFGKRLRYLIIAGVFSGISYLIICGYPLYVLLARPGRPHGPVRGFGAYSSALLNLFTPTKTELFGFTSTDIASRFRLGLPEQTLYVGPVLLLVAILAVFRLRQQRTLIITVALSGLAALVLTLGPKLVLSREATGITLPWNYIGHLPLLDQMVVSRFSLYVGFAAIILLVLWFDQTSINSRVISRASALGIGALALISVLPVIPLKPEHIPMPSFFANHKMNEFVQQGDVVKTFPTANVDHHKGGWAMVWQSASDMRYRMTSGYFIGSSPDHRVLLQGISDAYDTGARAISAGHPADDRRVPSTEKVRESFIASHAGAIVIVPLPGNRAAAVADWTEKVTGQPGKFIDGVWIFDLQP